MIEVLLWTWAMLWLYVAAYVVVSVYRQTRPTPGHRHARLYEGARCSRCGGDHFPGAAR